MIRTAPGFDERGEGHEGQGQLPRQGQILSWQGDKDSVLDRVINRIYSSIVDLQYGYSAMEADSERHISAIRCFQIRFIRSYQHRLFSIVYIQAFVRCYIGKKKFQKTKAAAVKLQRVTTHSYLARIDMTLPQEEDNTQAQEEKEKEEKEEKEEEGGGEGEEDEEEEEEENRDSKLHVLPIFDTIDTMATYTKT